VFHTVLDCFSSNDWRSGQVWEFDEESVIRRLTEDGLHRCHIGLGPVPHC
jgi:hypothetical protein